MNLFSENRWVKKFLHQGEEIPTNCNNIFQWAAKVLQLSCGAVDAPLSAVYIWKFKLLRQIRNAEPHKPALMGHFQCLRTSHVIWRCWCCGQSLLPARREAPELCLVLRTVSPWLLKSTWDAGTFFWTELHALPFTSTKLFNLKLASGEAKVVSCCHAWDPVQIYSGYKRGIWLDPLWFFLGKTIV